MQKLSAMVESGMKKDMQTLDMKKGNYLKDEPAIMLNIGSVKHKSNIPSGYFMVVDTLGQVPYRPGGTHLNYSTQERDNQGGKNE